MLSQGAFRLVKRAVLQLGDRVESGGQVLYRRRLEACQSSCLNLSSHTCEVALRPDLGVAKRLNASTAHNLSRDTHVSGSIANYSEVTFSKEHKDKQRDK